MRHAIIRIAAAIGLALGVIPAEVAAHPAMVGGKDHRNLLTQVRQYVTRHGGRQDLAPLIVDAGERNRVPAMMLARLINLESQFHPLARNGYCAGLMQVDVRWWFNRGEDPWKPADNIAAGTRLLASLHKRYGSWAKALVAYNEGENGPNVTRGTSKYARTILER